jgi:malonyl-CoA O-methyltransferase
MDKQALMRNFSRYASLYDAYADLQGLASQKLLAGVSGYDFRSILEIGCGTGNYTLLLRERFKPAHIHAVDISKKMVEVAVQKLKARGVQYTVADAEKINLKEKFDLITSNACFQWFEDLRQALILYKGLLKDGGLISFSIFGPLTFTELSLSLKYCLRDITLTSANFMDKERLKEIMQENFNAARVEEVKYRESFAALRDLLKKIKYSGIRGNGLNSRTRLNRRLLRQIEEVYLKKFKKIRVTYQVFFCQGAK